MAQIRLRGGALCRILFYETENIILGAFRTGARCKWFYEIKPRLVQSLYQGFWWLEGIKHHSKGLVKFQIAILDSACLNLFTIDLL